MKRSIASLAGVFSTGRMVAEYTTTCYLPSAERHVKLSASNLASASALAKWRRTLVRGWPGGKVLAVEASGGDPLHVGSELVVKAKIQLGSLTPDDVQV